MYEEANLLMDTLACIANSSDATPVEYYNAFLYSVGLCSLRDSNCGFMRVIIVFILSALIGSLGDAQYKSNEGRLIMEYWILSRDRNGISIQST